MFETINYRSREKRCHQCFAYVRSNSRKCRYCGFVFKSTGKFIFDTIKQVLKIEKAYSPNNAQKARREQIFFTAREVEYLFDSRHYQILMYLVLNDINFLDESSLIELGETLSAMETPNSIE